MAGYIVQVIVGWYLVVAIGSALYYRYSLFPTKLQPAGCEWDDFAMYRYGLTWPARLVARIADSRNQKEDS